MSMTASDIAGEADAHHRAGRLTEAASLYRRILDASPDDAGAVHRLGVIAFQQADPAEALRMIGRAIDLDATRAEFHHDRGDVLRSQGRFDDACASYRQALALDPGFRASHVNLAQLLHQQGRFADAVGHYDRALALAPEPDGADLHYNAANALREQDELDAAASRYRSAFAQNPKHWPALFNLAHVLQRKGATAEAGAAYRRVVALEPEFAAAHFNLAALNEAEGRTDEAIAGYRAALEAFPASHDAHNNLANLLASRGRAEEAVAEYTRAIALKPDFAEAHGNLGNLQAALGQSDEAIGSLRRAWTLKPSPALKSNFARALASHPYTRADDDLAPLVVQALTEPWARPADLAPAAARLLQANPAIGAMVARAATLADTQPLDALLEPAGAAALVGDPLFVALMTSTPVGDIALERLLTQIRAALWSVDGAAPDEDVVELAALLARQCHLNDHVFASAATEDRAVETARAALVAALDSGGAIAPFAAARLACYVPLATLQNAERLLERAWPGSMPAMIRQVVAEPQDEARIAAALPALTPIDDATSKRVRQQYEEHPYPVWTLAAPVEAARSFDAWLHSQLPGASFAPLGDRDGAIDLLIAGCGTGQHLVETARRFPRARIVALDLSRASLAYATRKAREAGIANVELVQGDLLGIAEAGRTYDVVEAAGVLHHLADPSAGWRSLLAVLRPGGFLLAALYGDRAREAIVGGRAHAVAQGYRATSDDIRRFRQEVLATPADSPLRRLIAYRDFHSTSECRDMLFHVEEHRTTIPAIKALLAELGLRFVGFALPPAVAGEYARRNPKDRMLADLDRWHAFESDVPGAFAGMYEFWVQKPPSP